MWGSSGVAYELRKLLRGDGTLRKRATAYWEDKFNRIDLPAMLLTIAAVASAVVLDGAATADHINGTVGVTDAMGDLDAPSELTRTLRSFATLTLWMRLMRLLLVFPGTGPYVLMFFRMFGDVLQFLKLMAFGVVCLSSALYVLFERHASHRAAAWSVSPLGLEDQRCDRLFDSYFSTLVFVFEGALTGSEFFECARTSAMGAAAWVLALFYVILASLLLLNMLIAMMASACDVAAALDAACGLDPSMRTPADTG